MASARVLDVRVTELLSAANVTRLVPGREGERPSATVESARELDRLLAQHRDDLGSPEVDAPRYATAAAVKSLLEELKTHAERRAGRAAARRGRAGRRAPRQRSGRSPAPQSVARALHAANWEVLRALGVRHRRPPGRGHARCAPGCGTRPVTTSSPSGLVDELRQVEREAVRLLALTPPAPAPRPAAGRGRA